MASKVILLQELSFIIIQVILSFVMGIQPAQSHNSFFGGTKCRLRRIFDEELSGS